MTVRTTADQAAILLSRSITAPKTSGVPTPDVEAVAIIQRIATTLLVHPSAALYIALQAKSGLLKAANDELAAIQDLTQAIQDLTNPSYTITDTTSLTSAKNALVQMEGLPKTDTYSLLFKKFTSSVNDFMQKQLAKNIRAPGSTAMLRPSEEAKQAIPGYFSALQALHADLLDRMYALAVCVENFQTAPLSSIVGLSTAFQARNDLEDIIAQVGNGLAPANSRDVAVRLVTDVAAMKTVSTTPDIYTPTVDGQNGIPAGYALRVKSPDTAPVKTGLAGPYNLLDLSGSITVGGQTAPFLLFSPQNPVGNPLLVSSLLSYAATIISPHTDLYFELQSDVPGSDPSKWTLINGAYVRRIRVTLNISDLPISMAPADVVTAIQAQASDCMGADYQGHHLLIWSYPGRWLTILTSLTELVIHSTTWDSGGTPVTVDVSGPITYANSALTQFGFTPNQGADSQSVTASLVAEFFNLAQGLALATVTSAGQLVVTAKNGSPGITMSIHADAALGISCTDVIATSNTLTLYGKSPSTPIDPSSFMGVGDCVSLPDDRVELVATLSSGALALEDAVPTFDDWLYVKGAVQSVYKSFDSAFQTYVLTWLKGWYANGLPKLATAMAALTGAQSAVSRTTVLNTLEELRQQVDNLSNLLQVSTFQLPDKAGALEKAVVDGITSLLIERRYDQTLDLLMRGRIYEVLEATYETASYGGSLLKALSDIARADISFPDPDVDDSTQNAIGSQERDTT